jgi:hypothetical protein
MTYRAGNPNPGLRQAQIRGSKCYTVAVNKLLWLKHIELQIPDDVEEALYLDLSVKRLSTEEKKSTQLHARRRITLILRYG